MRQESAFVVKLAALAKLCRFELDETIISLYDKALSPLGYENLSRALDQIILKRDSRDPLPSIKEITEIIRPELNDDSEAREAAGRIVQAVSKFGYSNRPGAQNFVGELGWRVVERFGGWSNVCQSLTPDNIGILQSQFFQLAKSQIQRAKAGFDDVAPVIPLSLNQKRESNLLSPSQILEKISSFDPEHEPPKGA